MFVRNVNNAFYEFLSLLTFTLFWSLRLFFPRTAVGKTMILKTVCTAVHVGPTNVDNADIELKWMHSVADLALAKHLGKICRQLVSCETFCQVKRTFGYIFNV